MEKIMVRYADNYLTLRADPDHLLGYGLMRRTRQMVRLCRPYIDSHPGVIKVVDLGCADGHMLAQLASAFPDRKFQMTGFDRFLHGLPESPPHLDVNFLKADLFSSVPLPVPSGDADIVIASAFVKHHPRTVDLLREVHRLLKVGGILVMLDPRPWVVHVGRAMSHFSREHTPSVWSERSIRTVLRDQLAGVFQVRKFERYWMSPRRRLYVPWIEDATPSMLRSFLTLHQSAVLNKVRSFVWGTALFSEWGMPLGVLA